MYIPGCSNAYSISVTHSTNRVTSLPLALIIFKATMMQIESLRFNRFDRLVRITLNLQGAKREEPIGYSVNIPPVLFPKIDTLKIGNRSWVYIIYIYIQPRAVLRQCTLHTLEIPIRNFWNSNSTMISRGVIRIPMKYVCRR